MSDIKFSQLPPLSQANIVAGTYAPVVDDFTNYTVTMANLTAYVNQNSSNISVTGTVSATGNITGAYILGNGSQLTGLPATYGNANVAAYLPTFTGNLAGGNANISLGINSVSISPTILSVSNGTLTTQLTKDGLYGNVTATTVAATANVTSNLFIGNGSALTSITGANVSGTVANATYATTAGSATTATTVTANAQANITSVGILTSLSATGNVRAGSVLTDNYAYANGTAINFSGTYSNANVSSFMAVFGSNVITTTGNIQAGYFQGNGSLLTGITATVANAFSSSNANGTILTANTTSGVLNFSAGNNIAITGTGANNNILIGVTGTVANATYATSAGTAATATSATTAVTATSATTADSVTSASQPVITSLGTLTSLNVTGNVSGNYFIGNGSLLTGIGGGNTSNAAIQNGNSSVSIPSPDGTIILSTINSPNTSGIVVSANANVTIQSANGYVSIGNGGTGAAVFTQAFWGAVATPKVSITSIGGIVGNIVSTSMSSTGGLALPYYNASQLRAITTGYRATVGSMAAVLDNQGKIAYWNTAASEWRYINGDTAV
jgi:hypothetical protein